MSSPLHKLLLEIIPFLAIDTENKTFLYASIVDELKRYSSDIDVTQKLKQILLEIGRKILMTDEEYAKREQAVTQDGFLNSIKSLKKT